MKITKRQAEKILPILQRAVQAQIDRWDAERQIEKFFAQDFDGMGELIEDLAIGADEGTDVSIENAIEYMSMLEGWTDPEPDPVPGAPLCVRVKGPREPKASVISARQSRK